MIVSVDSSHMSPLGVHPRARFLLLAFVAISIGVSSLGVLLIVQGFHSLPVLVAVGGVLAGLLWMALFTQTSLAVGTYCFLVILIVLLPNITMGSGMPEIRFDQLFLVSLLPWAIYRHGRKIHRVEWLMAMYAASIALSIGAGFLLTGNPPLLRDWLELLKPVFWWMMFSLGLSIRWQPRWKEWALWVVLGAGAIVGMLAFAQRLDLVGINTWLTPLYPGNEVHLTAIQWRSIGTFPNADELGLFMAAVFCMVVVLLLFGSYRSGVRMLLLLYALAAAVSILMSATRMGLLSACVGSAFLVWAWARRSSIPLSLRTGVIGLIILAVTVVTVSLVSQLDTFLNRWGTTGSVLSSGNPIDVALYRFVSLSELDASDRRLSDWQQAWRLSMESPIFGSGPSKGIDEVIYFHSDYLVQLRRSGFLGLMLFVLIYVSVARRAFLSFRSPKSLQGLPEATPQQRLVDLAVLMALLVFAMGGAVVQVFLKFQLTAFLWWMAGLLDWTSVPAT